MDLRTYLETHDGQLSKKWPELQRLARSAKASASHTYLCALRLKTPSRKLAMRYKDASIGQVLDPAELLGLVDKEESEPATLPVAGPLNTPEAVAQALANRGIAVPAEGVAPRGPVPIPDPDAGRVVPFVEIP